MKNWLKKKLTKWLGVDDLYSKNLELHQRVQSCKDSVKHYQRRLNNMEELVRECTKVSADIHYHHTQDSVVFIAGRYRNKDYVKLFNVPHKDMNTLVELLKDTERRSHRGYYDAPLQMNIESWIDRF